MIDAGQLPVGWWLHIDLDVLDGREFSACGAASDPSMPEGLTWTDLTALTSTALQTDGCRGWNIGVYNPELDPGNREAERIVAYIVEATANLGRSAGAPSSYPTSGIGGESFDPAKRAT